MHKIKWGGHGQPPGLPMLMTTTVREHYTSSSVLETVQKIQTTDARYFTTFDAGKGYRQIELHEESKLLTTFITPFGRFYYNRAPFCINSISEHYIAE